MAEPPSGWTTPDDPPDDQTPEPTRPAPNPPAAPPANAAAWGPPPAPGEQPGWGAPPSFSGQPGWGAPAGNWSTGGWSNRGPGIVPLHPLTVTEIYEGAIRAIRGNPRTMVGFSAVVIAVLTLLATGPQALALHTFLNSPLTDPQRAQDIHASDVAGLVGAGGLTVVVGILEYLLATTMVSAVLIVAVDSAVRGQVQQPGQLWTRVRPRLFAVVGLALLLILLSIVAAVVGLTPGLALIFLPGGTEVRVIAVILLVFGVLFGVIASIGLYLGFWAVAAPALLLENRGVFAALARSYRLVRGSFWRVLGIGILTAVVASFLREAFSVPFSVIGSLVTSGQDPHAFTPGLIRLLITDIGVVAAGAVVYPFTAGVSALLYLDLRMRREGLDVDVMSR